MKARRKKLTNPLSALKILKEFSFSEGATLGALDLEIIQRAVFELDAKLERLERELADRPFKSFFREEY